MAPAKNKWIRRFIITETKRHKKGFTIYKVISMVFLKFSHEEVSKVSVWKRYNDFKKLHSELNNLHKRLEIKETFPILPRSKYFGRFEAEVVEERKRYALKFLEFVGRYSYLYSSDIFVTFFETSYTDNYTNDCAHSLNSDTSEDDRIAALNDSIPADNTIAENTFQIQCLSKIPHNVLTNSCSTLSNIICVNENKVSVRKDKSDSTNLQNINVQRKEQGYKTAELHMQDTFIKDCNTYIRNNFDKNNVTPNNVLQFDNLNNNISKDLSNYRAHSIILHKEVNLSQAQPNSMEYLLIAAAHMSTAFKHESIAEYEKAFTQYKLGILCLINGIQFDSDDTRVLSVKDKISKCLVRAEQLYNRYLNYNVSIINKPVSELQYYKVLKVMKSVMLVMDIRVNCNRIIKTIEKPSVHEDTISNYILHRKVPYMVYLYAYIETETTVFLILQYANCGKLWDMIKAHYKASDNFHTNAISYGIHTNEHVNEEYNSNENIDGQNKTDEDIETNKQGHHQHSIDVQNKIYIEVPTMQLLEKSQKLLQSVNATLKKSNSIANRLNESKELRHSENVQISSLNTKAVIQISHESNLTLASVYDKSLNSDNIKIDDIIVAENHSIKSVIENKGLNGINFISRNSENSEALKNICTSVLRESCMTRNSLKNKTSDVFYNNSILKTVSTNMVYFCKNNIENTSDRKNSSNVNYTINEMQYPHLRKENNMDEEQKLWEVPEIVIRPWAAEILLALEALHQQNILILDFKPDNILLDDAGHIRLTYIVPQHNVKLSKLTYPYSSPESTMFSPTILITSATDIWSFGVVLYELLTGIKFAVKHPRLFHSHSTINIPSKLSESAKSLLCGMLKYYPDERLTIDEIKRHSFFTETDWSSMINSQI